MKDLSAKKMMITIIPLIVIFYLVGKASQAFRLAIGADVSAKVLNLQSGFAAAFENPLPSIHPHDLLAGVIGAILIALMLQMKKQNAKKFRKNVEYGSARWGNKKDIAPYTDPKPENNVILTKTESITMNSRPSKPKYARNKNILVVGGSGSGKTRFFIKPNLMQCEGNKPPVSFVVTDPKGTVLIECGKLLRRGSPKYDKDKKIVRDKDGKIVREPYKIKVLNTIDFSKSMKYNPFEYIRNETDRPPIRKTLKLVGGLFLCLFLGAHVQYGGFSPEKI